ncbi:protein S40-1-like [Nicotiana tomentosiformis]|uniref:Senescence regulator S40 n=1 Tax=Nicotiana tabacum TaxID=4097 RepID=A0A1S4BNR9_TOBAC|nr:PREDICTED: uncharacterized protein LOC107810246 [Nicotiana tabacum]XP_018626146.1 uncharacterized protein LOC104095761 [Nicotiana tomentosiformis]
MTSSNEGTYNFKNEEFQEEDIWGTNNNSVIEKSQLSSKFITSKDQPFTLNQRRQIPTAAKIMIPKSNKNSIKEFKIVQHSAPVKIPDWSKIYGTSLKKDIGNFVTNNSWESDDQEIEENDEGNIMPPHEWLAKRLGRSQISSFSVCEGVGRTLKGRDLSRVRNAVLTKTGFLE